VADELEQTPKVEPPLGMYPAKLDDKGRMKFPSVFQEYFAALPEKKLFVTSLDRRIAQIYPRAVWRKNEKFFETYRTDPARTKKVAFNAADLGSETEMDSQGRIVFSPELRRELGIENQPVHLFAYRGHIEVLNEQIYLERKQQASQTSQEDVEALEAVGLD
jgi:DNA-binding transcriptional regulator/RsmH inhibitor MraZ